MLVYPKLHRLERQLLFSVAEYEAAGHNQLERSGGMEEFFGLRAYHEGDSLKTIDWRHSARTGEWVSREMTQPAPARVTILLDLRNVDRAIANGAQYDKTQAIAHENGSKRRGKTNPELTLRQHAIERAISLAASVAWEGHLQGYQVGLAVAGCPFSPLSPRHSVTHRTRLLQALAELDVTTTHDNSHGIPFQPSVIVTPGVGSKSTHRGAGDRRRTLRRGGHGTVFSAVNQRANVTA